jgi:hypothetical protein
MHRLYLAIATGQNAEIGRLYAAIIGGLAMTMLALILISGGRC